ncbi:MAG: cupin domain-containing protein [Sinobacterium sp.]|nr:cupin domain-containing protein [Sinobacterium sp.]
MQLNQATQDLLHGSFLKEHWQKKSLFFSQCFDDNLAFDESVDINELAGFALEEGIESRLIKQNEPQQLVFALENGPFSEEQITSLPPSHWTLLIQAVDHYLEDFQHLKQQFDFIGNWRLDDVMISISPVGGTVGPHFDQYDVFLIQASGTREWKIGQQCDENSALISGNSLGIIDDFHAEQTHQCSVGDMLYIPPGKSHWGTASSDNCVTISIGFRAPSYQEILDDICLEVSSTLSESQRFEDKPSSLAKKSPPALITNHCIDQIELRLKELVLNKQLLTERFNAVISQVKYTEDFSECCENDAELILQEWLTAQTNVVLRSNSRINYSELNTEAGEVIVGLNGEIIKLDDNETLRILIQELSQYQVISIKQYTSNPSCKRLLLQAISQDAIEYLE